MNLQYTEFHLHVWFIESNEGILISTHAMKLALGTKKFHQKIMEKMCEIYRLVSKIPNLSKFELPQIL